LNPAGRLDKDSSGLLVFTNNGKLANELTHPRNQKTKIYVVNLDIPLGQLHQQLIADSGIKLDDGVSRLGLAPIDKNRRQWKVTMHEGRNRQIRRTFEALGYKVIELHRTHFGPYALEKLESGKFSVIMS
jgi:23S rRNA pseudouridine2605 synthase